MRLAGLFAAVSAVCIGVSTICSSFVLSVSAEDENIRIAIDQKTLTLEELKSADYTVPVFVRLEENAGINSAEMIIQVDSRCSVEAVTNPRQAHDQTNEWLVTDMVTSSTFHSNVTRFLWASANVVQETGALVLLWVHLPEDTQNGDTFTISYLPEMEYRNYQFSHLWGTVGMESKDYVLDNQVTWSDGWIRIEDSAQTELLPGDINMDGTVDILDVVMGNRVFVGVESITSEQQKAYDVNHSGSVDLADSMLVLQYLVHLIDSLEL
ncbi:MAG: dockerin type I repeat-containing protein [Oscillospiraceae bacterium]|nr:dockerin type I repeat-containing protein [Oscillospiraceae bacterium]